MPKPARSPAAAAAYERLNEELRHTRRSWILTAIAAVGFTALILTYLWSEIAPGDTEQVEGIATGTRHMGDDEGHYVHLVVELDGGESIAVSVKQTVPIGSRVIVKRRTTFLGRRQHAFVRVVPR
jgi:hypothetical protein